MEVPKEKVPKEEAPKRRGASKYWWVGGAAVVLAALIGILPQLFNHRETPLPFQPPDTIHVVPPPDTIDVEIPPLSPRQKELYDQAVMLWKDGISRDALKKLDKLISVRPDYVNAYIIRGRIYLENLKQYHNAVVEFKRGFERDPHNEYLLYDLGLSYYYLGDISLAIEWNQKALNQAPDLIIAIYNHAIYHVDYGKKYNVESYYDEAIELYENVIEQDDDFAVSARFNLAALYARLAKQESNKTTRDQYVKKAVQLLDRAIKKEGLERLKKVTGEIPVPYGEDLKAIYQDPDYKRMIEKWKRKFH